MLPAMPVEWVNRLPHRHVVRLQSSGPIEQTVTILTEKTETLSSERVFVVVTWVIISLEDADVIVWQ